MIKQIAQFTVQVTDTIQTAMQKITANKHRAVVVVDGTRVVGTVSDGDIRRAFLKEVLPLAPVEQIMNLNCRTTMETDPTEQRKAIMRERVTVLPVVNGSGELLDVVLAYEPFDKGQDDAKA
jgi:CBS domain-containing protein